MLHARASEWYEKNGRVTAAVDHALRCEDYDRAVSLVEKNIFQMMDNSELVRQSELVSKLPVSVLQSTTGINHRQRMAACLYR